MKKYIVIVILIIIIPIITKSLIVSTYTVISGSMLPTLVKGDKVFSLKLKSINQKIMRNEIVVFKPTISNNQNESLQIKRCVGLPGDTIEIKKGLLYINGKADKILNKLYQANVNITSEKDFRLDFLKNTRLFPNNSNINFSIINFGPLVIPQKGTSIKLTEHNQIVYNSVTQTDQYPSNSNSNKEYTFKANYYFVLGDNFFNSIDSRHWGFLPEDNIVGKAKFILFPLKRHSNRKGLIGKFV